MNGRKGNRLLWKNNYDRGFFSFLFFYMFVLPNAFPFETFLQICFDLRACFGTRKSMLHGIKGPLITADLFASNGFWRGCLTSAISSQLDLFWRELLLRSNQVKSSLILAPPTRAPLLTLQQQLVVLTTSKRDEDFRVHIFDVLLIFCISTWLIFSDESPMGVYRGGRPRRSTEHWG